MSSPRRPIEPSVLLLVAATAATLCCLSRVPSSLAFQHSVHNNNRLLPRRTVSAFSPAAPSLSPPRACDSRLFVADDVKEGVAGEDVVSQSSSTESAAAADDDDAADDSNNEDSVEAELLSVEDSKAVSASAAAPSSTEKKTLLQKIQFWKKGSGAGADADASEDDGLTFKQKLRKMGLAALLSYGFVSNMSYCVTVSLAWFGFSKKTGLSPLAPDQWKGFLAVYAGFYVFNNFVRPFRLAMSVGVTPYFDRAIAAVQHKTGLSKRQSIGVVVFLANFCGTLTVMALGILLAGLAAGVPVFPPKA